MWINEVRHFVSANMITLLSKQQYGNTESLLLIDSNPDLFWIFRVFSSEKFGGERRSTKPDVNNHLSYFLSETILFKAYFKFIFSIIDASWILGHSLPLCGTYISHFAFLFIWLGGKQQCSPWESLRAEPLPCTDTGCLPSTRALRKCFSKVALL